MHLAYAPMLSEHDASEILEASDTNKREEGTRRSFYTGSQQLRRAAKQRVRCTNAPPLITCWRSLGLQKKV